MIRYDVLTKEELQPLAETLTVDEFTMNVFVYKGFYYFSPLDFSRQEIGTRFVLARDAETGEIVGVMKTKRYEKDTHEYVPEEDADEHDTYIAIRYVNTREDRRQEGIAKGLYGKLAETLEFDDIVIGSPVTADGKKAGLESLRASLPCETYRSLQEYEDGKYSDWEWPFDEGAG